MKNVKEIVEVLNTFNNYTLSNKSDDGRVNSLDSEDKLVEDIILNLSDMTSIRIDSKSTNRDEHDLVFNIHDIDGSLILSEGTDIKIVEPSNFTNTVSFIKLSKMIKENYTEIKPDYEE